jgi:hypothetical protein
VPRNAAAYAVLSADVYEMIMWAMGPAPQISPSTASWDVTSWI